MDDSLSAQWDMAQRAMPRGWRLDSLRCASSGLRPHERSDDWRAVAVSDGGARLEGLGSSAGAALEDLVLRASSA